MNQLILLQRAFEFSSTIHTAHLLTNIKAEHDALGALYSEFTELFDHFIECFMARYGKTIEPTKMYKLSIPVLTSHADYVYYIESNLKFWKEDIIANNILKNSDRDMINLSDGICNLLTHTIYLLSLS